MTATQQRFTAPDADQLGTREPVRDFGRSPLVSIDRRATLRDAARAMHAAGVGALVVNGDVGLAGVITERDIVDALAAGADPDSMAVAADMTRSVITARPEDPVLDVAFMMLEDDIRHIPLVDEVGRAWGMVSVRDLVRPLLLQAMTPPLGARTPRP